MAPIQQFTADHLHVNVYANRDEMGMAAAKDAAAQIQALLNTKEFINIIFAAAPSQNEMLFHLAANDEIDWSRLNAFHMDEYVGLHSTAPQRFGHFLDQAIFGKLPFHEVHYINGNASNPEEECSRYAALLEAHPVDMVCMGIGENTHIAFNDPHVADFNDQSMVKLVALDEVSRMQQVHDGCFASIEEVPRMAITLTVPALMRAASIFCVVPGINKAMAVGHTINADISALYPSTALRLHENARLYLDVNSASLMKHHPISLGN
jgi:glucosamine-6-phosphate deaminase